MDDQAAALPAAETSQTVDDAKENEPDFPFIRATGINLDVQKVEDALSDTSTDNFLTVISSCLPRLSDSVTISNGFIRNYLELLESRVSPVQLHKILLDFLPSIWDLTTEDLKRKIKKFKEKDQKERRKKNTYSNFLHDTFDLNVKRKRKMTPVKKKLDKKNKELIKSKRKLEEDVDVLGYHLGAARKKLKTNEEMSQKREEHLQVRLSAEELKAKQEESSRVALEKQEEHLQVRLSAEELKAKQEQASRVTLQKKVAGFKSAESRRKSSTSRLSSPPPSSSSSSTITSPLASPISQAIEAHKDIIIVDDRIDDHIFHGQRYLGEHGRQITSGHINTYFEFQQQSKPCSALKKREIQKRAKQLDAVATCFSGGTKEDKELLYEHLLRSDRETFTNVLQKAGYQLQTKMLPLQGLQIQSLLRMSTNGFRNLRRALTNLGMNILPSERGMVKEKIPRIAHVSAQNVESGTMGLLKSARDDDVVPCAFVSVKSLNNFLTHIIDNDPAGFNHDDNFDGKWWLLFGGDKGGNHMKFHIEVVNSLKAGSVDNVHLYCLFEAADTPLNMRKVWTYRSQVKELMKPGFKIQDREVEVFLGGDFHFLDDMLGHQGSSATYPSSVDYVTLDHLRKHAGSPHTPETCNIPLRTTKEYEDYYHANKAHEDEGDMRLDGKEYYSIVAPMIFPVQKMENVVPATLHIMLGIVLLLYNMLIDICRVIDGTKTTGDDEEEEESTENQEYQLASLKYDGICETLRHHAVDIITMVNRLHRFEAVKKGDLEENETTAKMGYKGKSTANQDFEICDVGAECSQQWCMITKYDIDDLMVQCDKCDKWFHAMCDAVLPSFEVNLKDDHVSFICAHCQFVDKADGSSFDRVALFEMKIARLVAEEDVLNDELVAARRDADDKKSSYNKTIGEREAKLGAALENMNVERQAYHGNVFVGNHCLIVLERHQELTNVIIDHPKYADFNKIFEIFNQGVKYMMARRFLKEYEIAHLTSLCKLFGAEFPTRFVRPLTRKMHEYICTVPRFAKRWRTVGMFSEQEGESKHAAVKTEMRLLTNVRAHKERIRLVMEKEELRSSMDKAILNPKPRKCSVCPGRVFLRAGTDSKKHCNVCEPSFFKI